MNDTVQKLMSLVDRYWDLAYAEGAEGRTHDTPAGDAARTRQAMQDELTRLFTPLMDGRNRAAQICQDWIDDHSKADNCTYNDCDMVAAVTDVMNKIKWMFRNEQHSTEADDVGGQVRTTAQI